MRPLSPTVLEWIDRVRGSEQLRPLLPFRLHARPEPARDGWEIGTRLDGPSLVVTPSRRAYLLEGATRTAFYDWLRTQLEGATRRVSELPTGELVELVEAEWGSVDAFIDAQGMPSTGEDLMHFFGATDADDETSVEDWLPQGVTAADVESWTLCEYSRQTGEDWGLFRDEAGFIVVSDGEVERLAPRDAVARIHRVRLRETLVSLLRELPEPWSEWGTFGYLVLASPLVLLGSVVGGLAIAAIVAVLGLFLTEMGVPIPPAPAIGWFVGVPTAFLFCVACVLLARHGGD